MLHAARDQCRNCARVGTEQSSRQCGRRAGRYLDDDEATTVTFFAANDYRLKRQNQRSRWRDLLFTLHFMDYMSTSNQSDFNHLLIRIAALLTLVFAFSGWILMIRQRRRLSLR